MAASGVYRGIVTGVTPGEAADGALDQAGIPDAPIRTDFQGPWGQPWFDGLEDPYISSGTPMLQSPEPHYPDESFGAIPIVGPYDGSYRTVGPVREWGHEPSGGLYGNQALGRIMRFPTNWVERYDRNGVKLGDYRDELAAAIASNGQGVVSEAEYTTELLLLPNVRGY
jgi:hypothetical protein